MGSATVMFERICSFNGESTSQNEAEKRKCCGDLKCELVGYDSLPEYLKDNEFILNHYRSEWPLKETILSAFSIHNETLNIWTHLIGFLIFLALTVFAVAMFRAESPAGFSHDQFGLAEANDTTSLHSTFNLGYTITNLLDTPQIMTIGPELGRTAVARWPFFAFLLGAMVCLLTSSACHLLMCHSEQCAYKMLRLDYTGITALIVTSFYPLVYYTFACDPFFCWLYISVITLFGVATILVSLVPFFQTPEFRPARSLLFACMALSGLVPIAHKVIAFGDRPEAIVTAQYELVMGLFYGVGVVLYAARIPERWMPGKFDLVGHSHQLFHVLVIAGAYTHYLAATEYLKWRDMEGCYR